MTDGDRETLAHPIWTDALTVAALLAVDPSGLKGAAVRARAGPVRSAWLSMLDGLIGPQAARRRITSATPEARLIGGLDLAATLAARRPVAEKGVLSAADGGCLTLAMAERTPPVMATLIGAALDDGAVTLEREGFSARLPARFVLIALDEGAEPDETLPSALADRLALSVDLETVGLGDVVRPSLDRRSIEDARARLPHVAVEARLLEAVVAAAASVSGSMRRPQLALSAARALAALTGRTAVEEIDAVTALRLVLGVRPAAPQTETEKEEAAAPPPQAMADDPPPAEGAQDRQDDGTDAQAGLPDDWLLAAADAALPQGLLLGQAARSGAPRAGRSGAAGALQNRGRRGRAIGAGDRPPFPGARLNVLATLRQAAPWQRLRSPMRDDDRQKLKVRPADFRYTRYRERRETTAIFAVDASGSAAMERLAETKGAVELLLAECYVRRDEVGLVAFRGTGADILLPPTRSLLRAKRALAGLPGGGGTPLAAGLRAALAMAETLERAGRSTITVIMTDGRGNIALDGTAGRARAGEEAEQMARRFRAARLPVILIDPSMRPQQRARQLAGELGADYLALPRAGSAQISTVVAGRMRPGGRPGHDGAGR